MGFVGALTLLAALYLAGVLGYWRFFLALAVVASSVAVLYRIYSVMETVF